MKCPRCQAENDERLKFCEDCGALLAHACPNCGVQVRAGKKFCGECGASQNNPPRFASPDQYTPKHLAERILLSKPALEGERKQVTVLFADLKGSMELLTDRDPEEARNILDPVLERMMGAVHRYEGTVNQVMGDGIMALFGAPLALEDHAVRACYAALYMQEAVRRHAEKVRRSEGVLIQIRIGVNSGEVVVRSVGSDLRMDYSAVGETTHLAARMEQIAAPGSATISANTLRLVESYMQVRALGAMNVKGLNAAVEVYELVAAGSARTRFQAAAARGLTKFVGRGAELTQMFSALEATHTGHGQVVAFVGEPGVGKSRLVWELTHSHRTQDLLVLESASVSYGKATAYRPIIDMLKSYFQIEDRDDERRIREKTAGKLLILDEALKPHLVALLALLDVPVHDERWKPLDPVQKRMRTLDACKRLILREAQVQPLVLVFEDLHWIDTETQALLDSLVESLPTARLMLLVNFRPEYQSRWTAKTYYTQLHIDPLTGETARELLRSLLGTDRTLQPLVSLLIERTEGNPLYLEESVRSLHETGALQGNRGAYQLTAPITSIQVPATVQAILAARIDRLAPDDKQLLQAAAVIGKDVPYALLQAIAELPEESLRQQLATLQGAEFLYEKSLFPDLEYTFKHALTHEVAYGSLLQERRKLLHTRIMASVEQLYADRLTEQIEQLAHHALRGEAWDKAVTYLRQASVKTFGRSAYREAVALVEQAILALSHLPRSRGFLEQEVDLRTTVHNSLGPLGEEERKLPHDREIGLLGKALNDQRLEALSHAYLSQSLASLTQFEEAIEHGMRALALAESLDDPILGLLAKYALGNSNMHRGAYRRAIEFFQRDVGLEHEVILGQGATPQPRGLLYRAFTGAYSYCETNTAYCLAELGQFDAALEHCEKAVKIGEVRNFVRLNADAFLGFVYLRRGDHTRALGVMERSLHAYANADGPLGHLILARALGAAYNRCGRIPEATEVLEQAWSFAEPRKQFAWGHPVLVHLAEAYGLAEQVDKAISTAKHALEISHLYGGRGYEAWTWYVLGNIYTYPYPPMLDQARDAYRQALALAEELRMLPLCAHCHLGLGQLHATLRDARKVREHLGRAVALYQEVGMQHWHEQAESALRAL